jgi:Glycosyl transferase family 2
VWQANAGPGGARNRGLEVAEQDGGFDFVAFLDSDDVWLPTHLGDALAVLQRRYDFYCCDNSREGIFARFSDDVALLNDGGRALAGRATVLDPGGPVLGFPPHALDDEFVTGYLSHTSTVVLRASRCRGVRFDPDLRNASEDRMFWLTVVLSGAAVVISWRCNVICGRGVNVFFAAYDWNQPATLERNDSCPDHAAGLQLSVSSHLVSGAQAADAEFLAASPSRPLASLADAVPVHRRSCRPETGGEEVLVRTNRSSASRLRSVACMMAASGLSCGSTVSARCRNRAAARWTRAALTGAAGQAPNSARDRRPLPGLPVISV